MTINLDPHLELNVARLGFGVKEYAMMTMKNEMLQKIDVQQKKGRNFEAGMTQTHDTVNYAFSMLQFIC